jgi:hypothetical protein
MLWDALQAGNEVEQETEVELPTLPDVSDHPYYQQFNSSNEDEE